MRKGDPTHDENDGVSYSQLPSGSSVYNLPDERQVLIRNCPPPPARKRFTPGQIPSIPETRHELMSNSTACKPQSHLQIKIDGRSSRLKSFHRATLDMPAV